MLQQERHLVLDVSGIDHMEVIKHQHDVGADRAKLVSEGRHDRLDGRWLGLFHHQDCLSRGGHRSMERCRHAEPEGDGLVVSRLEGHPYRDQSSEAEAASQSASKVVLPKPGGAEMSVTLARIACLSRSDSRGRRTKDSRGRGM